MSKMSEQDKQFLSVMSVELDLTPVFHHFISLRREDNSLVDRIKVSADKSDETLNHILELWSEVKKKYRKENNDCI